MTIKDDELRRLYGEYVRGRMSGDRKACPDPEVLMQIATPGTKARNRKAILDHIGGCPDCSSELRLILDICREGEVLSSRLAPTRKSRSLIGSRSSWPSLPSTFVRFAFAFLGAAVTIISLYVLVHPPPKPDEMRSGRPSIGLNAPIGDLSSSAPLLFEWKSLPGADHYILELYDEELLPVWTSEELAETRFLLPGDVARRLSTDRPYYWLVTAYSGMEKIADSDLVHFVLRAR
jgi:hypothetical protein